MSYQTTISDLIKVDGVNVYNGNPNSVTFHPAPENSGLVFKIGDEKIPAELNLAERRKLSIWLIGEKAKVGLVEHLLSPIYALCINNLEIELSDGICPTTDNCAGEFFSALKNRKVNQDAEELFWKYRHSASFSIRNLDNSRRDILTVKPSDDFIIEDTVFYPHEAVRDQHVVFQFSEENYESQIMNARSPTFFKNDFLKDIFLMMGRLGFHGVSDERYLLVTSKSNEDYANSEEFGVRYQGDEFVRHKVLDVLGTLALTGRRFKETYFHFDKTGHQFDLHALRRLFAEDFFVDCN